LAGRTVTPVGSSPVASTALELPFTIDFFYAPHLLSIGFQMLHSLDFIGERV
jgi:hypothetical protein